jgi:hypothetical protein
MTLLSCFLKASGSSTRAAPSSSGSVKKRIRTGPARPPAPGPLDWPRTGHRRRRYVVFAEERCGLHVLGWQRDDLQLQLEVAFGGGADGPVVEAADCFVLPTLGQGFEERLLLVRRSAGQLDCNQLLSDAG